MQGIYTLYILVIPVLLHVTDLAVCSIVFFRGLNPHHYNHIPSEFFFIPGLIPSFVYEMIISYMSNMLISPYSYCIFCS